MKNINRTFVSDLAKWIPGLNSVKNKLIFFFSTLLICTTLLCCTDDQDQVFRTFLEQNNNTEWVLSNPELSVYIRINNDQAHLIEQWRYDIEKDCYEYNPNIFNPGDYQIMENTEDQLIVSCDAILGDCDKLTFHLEGNTLQVDVKLSEFEEETVYFLKSKQNLNDLGTCEVDDNENRNTDKCSFLCLWN